MNRDTGGNIIVVDADRLFSRGTPAPGNVPWIYAGSRYQVHRKLLLELGKDREIPFKGALYTTTCALRDDYIAFIGDLNCRRRDPDWQFSSLAEKNCFISPVYGIICTLAAAKSLVEGRSDPEILVVCDTSRTAAYLRGLLAGAPPGTRAIPWWQVLLSHLPRAIRSRMEFLALGIYHRLVGSLFNGRGRKAGRYAVLSFVYGGSFRDGYTDVVFGPLVPWLEGQGWNPAIIPLVVPPTSYLEAVRKMRAAGKTFLVPELYEPPGRRTLYALSSLLHPPGRLPPLLFHGIPVTGIFEDDLIRDWAGRRVLESRILGDAVGKISAGGAFRAITYPYENHVWEKAVCTAVRSQPGGTCLIGFQHSTLYSLLLNYFIAPCESALPYLPHRVITGGSRAHDLLLRSGYREGMLLPGGAIRYSRPGGDAPPPGRGEGPFTILVATTVDPNESVELISRVIDTFGGLEGVGIVVRCHPDLPFDRIAPQLGQDLPPNATVGSGNPAQLREAGVLVFSSTSVAMEALAVGVPVIQVSTMDPLIGNRFEGIPPSGMLQFARTNEELRRMVEALRAAGPGPADRAKAGEIVKLFFGPVDDRVYSLFLPGGPGDTGPAPGHP